jgi:hypothetical protein
VICWARHLVPVLTTCARRRWSYAQRVHGVVVGVSCIAKAAPVMARQASQNLNDIRYAALAYTCVRNVCPLSRGLAFPLTYRDRGTRTSPLRYVLRLMLAHVTPTE